MNWSESYVKQVLLDLAEENPLACRALFRISKLRFTENVQTLAVSLTRDPQLLINRSFIIAHAETEQDLKTLLMHEFMHVLLLHTEKYRQMTPLMNIALDAIINALIHRNLGAEYSDLFRRMYKNRGFACLLRPMNSDDWVSAAEDGSRDLFSEVHKKIYAGKYAAEDLHALLEYLHSRKKFAGIPDLILIGNHEERGRTGPANRELLDGILGRMDGTGIWRRVRERGNADRQEAVLREIKRQKVERWMKTTAKILETCMMPDKRGRSTQQSEEHIMLVLGTRDRRAALSYAWSGIIPLSRHEHIRERPAESVSVYLDVSGSMNAEIDRIIVLLRRFRDRIKKPLWVFSNEVSPAVFEKEGLRYASTGGTSIACVLEHIRRQKTKKNLIVTDGYIESITPDMLQGIDTGGLFALISADGNPAELERNRINYIQLEELP
jgi:hypothetical protein